MFIIRSLDGKEYGPADTETVISWIIARRADANTAVRLTEAAGTPDAADAGSMFNVQSSRFEGDEAAGTVDTAAGSADTAAGSPPPLHTWHTLGEFPEFAAALATAGSSTAGSTTAGSTTAGNTGAQSSSSGGVYAATTPAIEPATGTFPLPDRRAYTAALIAALNAAASPFSIRSCFGRAYALCKSNYGSLLLGTLILVVLLGSAEFFFNILNAIIPSAGTLGSFAFSIFISPILYGGTYYFFIQRSRGIPLEVTGVFAGFKRLPWHLILASFVRTLIVGIIALPFLIFSILATGAAIAPVLAESKQFNEQLVSLPPQITKIAATFSSISTVATIVFGAIALISMLASIWAFCALSFAETLIVDKRLGFWDALCVSYRVAATRPWRLIALMLLTGLVVILGLLMCCIGYLFVLPYAIAAIIFAYNDLFCSENKTV